MDKAKRERLEAKGWKVGSAYDFSQGGATGAKEVSQGGEPGPELRILRFAAAKGCRTRGIARHVKVEEATVTEAVARLRQLGLLFEEKERFLSLVLDEELPAPGPRP